MMAEAAVLAFQSKEYAQAAVMYSDLELAWQLQLHEALAESAAMSGLAPNGEALAVRQEWQEKAPQARGGGDKAFACAEQSGELRRREQELVDQEKAQMVRQAAAVDMQRRWHDKEFARLVSEMPSDEWENVGDKFEKPFFDGKGKAAAGEKDGAGKVTDVNHPACHLYFAKIREDPGHVGIAWALTDASGHVLFQQSKMLGLGVSAYVADYTALINGLAYARSAGVEEIAAHGDSAMVTKQVTGQWRARSASQIKFLDQVKEHESELSSLTVSYLPKTKNSYVRNLARQAIQEYVAKLRKDCQGIPGHFKEGAACEDCPICFEKTLVGEMFLVASCYHKFCLNCLSQHVEVQVKENLVPVRCPLECSNHLELDQCLSLLPPKLSDAYARRLTEASVPEADRVYCPFPNCSALMSKGGLNLSVMGSSSSHPHTSSIGRCECMECHRLFCVECHVPWHADLSCSEYQKLPPDERDAEDVKLYQLARNQNWQRCKKCKHVIELNTGCYHMTCKCGHEFCYTCGAEWKNKQATCKCKLWDENNIIEEDDLESDDEYISDVDDSDSDHEYRPRQELDDDTFFYKTQMCRYWEAGHCWSGDNCRYAHGEEDLRRWPYFS